MKCWGKEAVIQAEPWMGTDSFPLYLQRMPGVYAFLGMRNEEKGIIADVHTSRHDLDEKRAVERGSRACGLRRGVLKASAAAGMEAEPARSGYAVEQAGYLFRKAGNDALAD